MELPSEIVAEMNRKAKLGIEADQGECAKCFCSDLSYGLIDTTSTVGIVYPYTCGTCGHKGNEYYALEHVEQD